MGPYPDDGGVSSTQEVRRVVREATRGYDDARPSAVLAEMSSRVRTLAILAISLLLSVALAELVTRVYFASQTGIRTLFYGTPWHRYEAESALAGAAKYKKSVQGHGQAVGDYQMYSHERSTAYSKYFPNEVKITYSPDGKIPYQVRINSHGFRGPDFSIEKPPGTLRVLTMGASSTFGYRNRDEETYPAQLQRILDERGAGLSFEVINFSVPHANSDNIVAMFRAEGLTLDPDFVTFYEGVNDAAIVQPPDDRLSLAVQWLADRLLFVQLLTSLFPIEAGNAEHMWSDDVAAARSRIFLENLETLRRECVMRGIAFIAATQQVKSGFVPPEKLRGVTYAEERDLVRAARSRGEIGPRAAGVAVTNLQKLGAALDPVRVFLMHDRLMIDLVDWAGRNKVLLADVRGALDERRDLLVSWVHLHPEANRVVAETLAAVILEEARRRAATPHA
jgi:lysophospholipase L1-like esterase